MTVNPSIIPKFSIFSGFALLGLLFLGLFSSIDSTLFNLLWGLHLFVQFGLVLVSLGFFYSLLRESSSNLILVSIFLIFLFVLILLNTFLPVTYHDVLIHHLSVPKLWLEANQIVKIPGNDWCLHPMLLNLAYLGFLAHGLESFLGLYHFSFLIIAAAISSLIVLEIQKCKKTASWAFLLTLSMPICIRLAALPMVDLGLVLFFGIATYYSIALLKKQAGPIDLFFLGSALGFSLGTKYNALLAVSCCLFWLFVFLLRNEGVLSSLKKLIVVSSISLFVFSPWLYKNISWDKQPFAPLPISLFENKPEKEAPAPAKLSSLQGVNPLLYRSLAYDEDLLMLTLIPLRMLFLGKDDSPANFNGVLSPVLVFFILILYQRRKDSWSRFAFLLILSYFLISLFFAPARIRYQLPNLCLLVACAALSLSSLKEILPRERSARLISTLLFAHFVFAICYAADKVKKANALDYYLESQTTKQYLYSKIPEYPMIDYINQNLSDNSKVFLIATSNAYYHYKIPVFGDYFSTSVFLNYVRKSETVDVLCRRFNYLKITHLMVNVRLLQKRLFQGDLEKERRFISLFLKNNAKVEYRARGYALWELSCKR